MPFAAKQKKSSRTICSRRRRGGDGGNRPALRRRPPRVARRPRRLAKSPRVRFPIKRKKKYPTTAGYFIFVGDGGNRTPVRKRFLRNFSGRRRLFAFPCPCASRHARGLGSFMMHGTLKALRTHGPHSSTPLSGPWASRKRRSRIKRREEQCCRCSLIYKLPVLWMPGASARYSCLRTPVETSTSPTSTSPRQN